MEKQIGHITHYFGKISVAAIELGDELKIGDTIHIQGHTTDFTQTVKSMQVEHEEVETVTPGMDVAIKVEKKVRRGDTVLKVEE